MNNIKHKNKPKIKSGNYMIDLFAGAGGLSCGLEMAGFTSALAIDNDKYSMDTFKLNHKHSEVICGDIRDVDIKTIKDALGGKKIKLICGGPPCQGFSTVGNNDPNDHRNHLFLEFVRVVKEIKPDYILVENVTGLISKNNNATLTAIIKCFTDLGYQMDIRVLSAHHYGVPETRRRTIILGNKFGLENIYPNKTYKDCEEEISDLPSPHTTKWAFDKFIDKNNKNDTSHNLSFANIKNDLERNQLAHIPEGKGVRYEVDEKKYLPKELWFDIDWSTVSEGRFRQTKLKRLSLNEPSPTINTFKSTYYHPTENRYLTPREAAAIQSFPADFIFCGGSSQQWRQIGNAVPPLLAKAIGEAILELDKTKHLLKKTNRPKGKIDIDMIRSGAFVYRKYKNKKSSK